MRRRLILYLLLGVLVWWWQTTPPTGLQIPEAVDFGPMDSTLESLARSGDVLGTTAERLGEDLPGYDDVVVLADGSLLASAMDGWIWRITPDTGRAERWIDVPLMPAGMRVAPDDPDTVYFCSAVLHGAIYPKEERVGLYALRLSTRQVIPITTDVPRDLGRSESPQVFPGQRPVETSGSRPLAFCNDLDVSSDGQRIYFSEPFAYEGASMGGGAFGEAITLGRHGRLWMHDRETRSTRLVARGFHFLDGVLIERGIGGDPESSILVTETTYFRIQRLIVSGPDAGRHEIVWRDLPGMPDGLDRDQEGNVWVGLLSLRSATMNWVHRNPWIKPLLLRLPTVLIPKGTSTGVLALDPHADKALFLALHDGSFVRDVSVAIPNGSRIYLASFDPNQRGLVWIPRPSLGTR